MKILGIETSCDETSAAVVEDGKTILSNVVASQNDLHRPFGGVVPEMAARAHAERITAIIDEAMAAAQCAPRDIDAVAVVNRPGLVGALLVGISAAKALCIAWNKPLLAMDHILAHAYASTLAGLDAPQCVALIVSGGHTCLYRVKGPLEVATLGQTTDDAAGEAFDKVAKMLDLGFPGGPALSKLAAQAAPDQRGLFRNVVKPPSVSEANGENPLDFSFSGLKTAVYYYLRGTTRGRGALRAISEAERAAVAASFEDEACEAMVSRSLLACRRENIRVLTAGGGVACNRRLREMMAERGAAESPPVRAFFPPPILCADNAAMTAGLAYHRCVHGEADAWDIEADPTPRRA
jgi:N6-L-threonylcarbamoyladenine synthase